MISSIKPMVGCPHIKQQLTKIRDSNYPFPTAVKDVVDNSIKDSTKIDIDFGVSENRIDWLTIHDDIERGFENIQKQGASNPFNMGHVRDGHSDDSVLSQYGGGMKEAGASQCNRVVVTTRSIPSDEEPEIYMRATLDFKKMSANPDPVSSYDPYFEPIYPSTYQDIHPYPTGSTIEFQDFIPQGGMYGTEKDIQSEIVKIIQSTYSDIIRCTGIQIRVKGVLVEPEIDIFEEPTCKSRIIAYEEKVVFEKEYPSKIKAIYQMRKGQSNTTTYAKLVGDKMEVDSDKMYLHCKEEYEHISIRATSTYGTPLQHIQYCSKVRVKRNGRNHGDVQFMKRKDGYMNHVCVELNYMSKRLNSHIGVGSTKSICSDKDTPVTAVIHCILVKLASETTTGLHPNRFKSSACNDSSDDDSVVSVKSAPKTKPRAKKSTTTAAAKSSAVPVLPSETISSISESSISSLSPVSYTNASIPSIEILAVSSAPDTIYEQLLDLDRELVLDAQSTQPLQTGDSSTIEEIIEEIQLDTEAQTFIIENKAFLDKYKDQILAYFAN
jgi:hypothetical protein